ncbi:leucine-rich repeat domain-containing protein, partial [Flavobacterium sp. 9AF]|uniref:leucine-rich repeat domain-containing protein n=1 Tax=Flavobacterium sp. 9AF TaxID=2653142 RepID=UPI00135B6226
MKKIYFLLLVLFGLNLQGQIINIPDANFKAKLLSANSSNQIASTEIPDQYGYVTNYNSIDTNNNGEIEESEAELITVLNIYESNIYDLTGIEYFSNLITLRCKNIQITNLDLTQLANLYFLDCSDNQLSTLNITQNSNLKYLYCYDNQLSDLNISQNLNLVFLQCSGNQLSSLNLSQNINLTSLGCSNNLLTTLDVSMLTNLNHLSCRGNQLSNLDVTQNLVLTLIECQNNELINLDVTQNLNLIDLNCKNNQLTNLDISQNINLRHLLCSNNLLTTLDASFNSVMNELICNNNQLNSLFIKNNNESWLYYYGSSLDFSNNPDLQYICADDEDITMIQQKIMDYNLVNCHVNSYCSFVPGGDYFSIEGQTIYDFNNNGCDLNDLNYSNLRFSITDGTVSGDLISNQSGNYFIPVQAGSHTITPILENPTYFNISPTSLTVDFPTQTSPFTQDFCVSANSIKHDVEVIVLPIVPARPGFDAYYKISYRNKGNQIENGSVSLTFDDAVLDYVSANPIYDSQATNSLTWNYSNLLPFETREIDVILNVNSPMETPAVNIGDQLNFLAQITPIANDEIPFDNTSALKQTVVGSYDPNDKTCLEGETVGPDMIGEYVHYLIRFENTGTYP